MTGLGDEGGNTSKYLHDCQHPSNYVSLGSPGDLAFVQVSLLVKDGTLAILDQLVNTGLLIEQG